MSRFLLAFAACGLLAQQEPPVAIVRGELLGWDPAGSYRLSTRTRQVLTCRFDGETYFVRQGVKIAAVDVKPGYIIEAVVDRRGEPGACRTLTLYVLATMRIDLSAEYRRALDEQRHVLDHIFPRGKLTFAGLVVEAGPDHLVLKTRTAGRKTLRLREDTRYTLDGRPADASMLEVNALVFVRAGEGIDGKLEAYQVVRGEILTPR
jgi:hypothetical protein